MKRITVFCGSNLGASPVYKEATDTLGFLLAERKIELVYGGGKVGLMGALADAVIGAGGKAIGVIPEFLLAKEVGHAGLTELKVVKTMHERKTVMAELGDAFIALPGGFGTFEELFEAVTWTQLGLQRKACGLLNVDGFYDPLLALVAQATTQNFIRPDNSSILVTAANAKDLLERLASWTPPLNEKWLTRAKT